MAEEKIESLFNDFCEEFGNKTDEELNQLCTMEHMDQVVSQEYHKACGFNLYKCTDYDVIYKMIQMKEISSEEFYSWVQHQISLAGKTL